MSSLQIGRLLVGPPFQWQEQVGDPVGNLGGVPIALTKNALRHSVSIGTLAADGQPDTIAARYTLRRQLRSLLNNLSLKTQSFLYLQYSDDPEQNGWYVPEQGILGDLESAGTGLSTGVWKLESLVWILAGHRRLNREARNIYMKDLRTGLYARDYLGWVYSTDFSGLVFLALTYLPDSASSLTTSVSGQQYGAQNMPTGRDGGSALQVFGITDLSVIAFDRPETSLGLTDVIVYDRRGQLTAPAAGPDTSWEEAYGPDYPWNWVTAGQPADAPVLDNGLVRVRYDASVGKPGFRVDVWNGAAYVEQGKMVVFRDGTFNGWDDTWTSAGLVEYTPDRAVMLCTLSYSGGYDSRERVYITLQRGKMGVTFECYPALKADGTQAAVEFGWTAAASDVNESALKVDASNVAAWKASAAGTPAFPFGNIGAATYTGENWTAILRYTAAYNTINAYQQMLTVLQAANHSYTESDGAAYGSARTSFYNACAVQAGYVQVQLGFAATASDQANEAETIRSGGGTTSQVADAAASGGQAVKDTQTSLNSWTLDRNPSNLLLAKYRCFVRVRVDSPATGSFNWNIGSTGSGATTTSTSWVWLDLGELTASAANPRLLIAGWRSAGASGSIYIDRAELVLIEDRLRPTFIYSGARDMGQAALIDSRTSGALVVR